MPIVIVNIRRKEAYFDEESEVPTVPSVEDHTAPGWMGTDIYKSEIIVNVRSQRVWTRTDFGILEFMMLGSTTNSSGGSYIGPVNPTEGTDQYQNDLLKVDTSRVIAWKNEFKLVLAGDKKTATHESSSGILTIDTGKFELGDELFFIIKPLQT